MCHKECISGIQRAAAPVTAASRLQKPERPRFDFKVANSWHWTKQTKEAYLVEAEKTSANSQEALIIKTMTWFYKSCETTA